MLSYLESEPLSILEIAIQYTYCTLSPTVCVHYVISIVSWKYTYTCTAVHVQYVYTYICTHNLHNVFAALHCTRDLHVYVYVYSYMYSNGVRVVVYFRTAVQRQYCTKVRKYLRRYFRTFVLQ